MSTLTDLPRNHPWLVFGAAAAIGVVAGVRRGRRPASPASAEPARKRPARDVMRRIARVALTQGARRVSTHLLHRALSPTGASGPDRPAPSRAGEPTGAAP